MGCINAETPDMYGHYRQAPFTMIKHHWWWKVSSLYRRFTLLQLLERMDTFSRGINCCSGDKFCYYKILDPLSGVISVKVEYTPSFKQSATTC